MISKFMKEDLNVVLKRNDIKKQIKKDLEIGRYIVKTHVLPFKKH